jgi:hypothetical protein
MVRSVRSTVFILVVLFAHHAAAADAPAAAIRIRIHDYARVDATPLASAQRIVSRMYDAIGVHTEWLASTRPHDDEAIPTNVGSTDLTIIVLTPEMASRRTLPEAVVGYAAVTRGEAGRIAFVIYDRVRNVARHADADITRVMGMVMAHEVGHLLLPSRSHSDNGLMRGHWAAADFSHLDALDLGFSLEQVDEIRRTIRASATIATATPAAEPPGADGTVAVLATVVD